MYVVYIAVESFITYNILTMVDIDFKKNKVNF